MKKAASLLFFISMLSANNLLAQNSTGMSEVNTGEEEKIINVKYIESPQIKLDGVLDEPEWEQAEKSNAFWRHFPDDKGKAKEQAEIRMFYNDKTLYISAVVHTVGNHYRTESLARDAGGGNSNDNIGFIFDTFRDRNNAYYFGLTPFGVVRDGLLSGGGVDGGGNLDLNWDVTWKAEAKIYDNYYIVEMAIPFFAFKFTDKTESWRFNCNRNDPQAYVNSSWQKVPRNRELEDLGYTGKMVFEKPLKKSRNPIAIIPYALYNFEKDFDNDINSSKFNFGGDAKIPIGTGSNLDLTGNPDFSSTDPPEGSTNITRFELNVDEQRQFFLDNADLFAGFGKKKLAQPFYSRRIGYGKDTLGNDTEVPILAGARFTGKINNNLRIGIMDVQTAKQSENEIPGNNNLVVAVEQKVFKTSNISALFINRQATKPPDYVKDKDLYNRVFGLDFNYFSRNSRWNGKAYLHKSWTPEAGNKDISAGAYIYYNSRKFVSQTNTRHIGDDFKSDLGFIKRTNTAMFNQKLGPKFYPKNRYINMIGVFGFGGLDWQPSSGKVTDYNYKLTYLMKFKNQSEFSAEYERKYTYLDEPFDPTKTPGAEPLPPGDYYYGYLTVKYKSDKSRLFSVDADASEGTYYNGNKFTGKLTLKYRVQPIFNASVKTTLDYIRLPDPHPNKTTVLYVGPNFNFTFTKKLFWTTDIQFNSQNESLGIYSKLQWRYRPLSDIFLIYRDNYHTGDVFDTAVRSIFLKITFWLNI